MTTAAGQLVLVLQFGSAGATTAVLLVALLGAGLCLLWRQTGPRFAVSATLVGLAGFLLVGSLTAPAAVAVVGVCWRRRNARRPATAPISVVSQFAIVATGHALYTLGRILVRGEVEPARQHAERIVAAEHSLGIAIEPALQGLALRSEAVIRGFNAVYVPLYLPVVLGVMLWLCLADLPSYRLLRDSLAISAALALLIIARFPAAPPRVLPGFDVVDTAALFGHRNTFTNQYAAMPSLHVGWTALAGHVLGGSIGGRRGALTRVIPGLLMTITVIVTGNHYLLDAAVVLSWSRPGYDVVRERRPATSGLPTRACGPHASHRWPSRPHPHD